MTPTGSESADEGLVQRVEALLGSLTSVVSARVILDQEKGAHVHIIATSELSVAEVSRTVMSVLTWGFEVDMPADQITVVQSSLSSEELQALLGTTTTDPPPTPVVPENPPTDPPDPRASNEESPALAGLETHPPLASFTAESPPPGLPDPSQSVPDTGLLEFGLDGMQREIMVASELDLPRLELQSLELNRNPQGGFDISLRLGDDAHSIGAERKGAGTEDDLLEVPASAALGVIEEFLRARIENELDLALRFLAAHRVLHLHHDVVVVLLEAVVRGRRIPLTGAASARVEI